MGLKRVRGPHTDRTVNALPVSGCHGPRAGTLPAVRTARPVALRPTGLKAEEGGADWTGRLGPPGSRVPAGRDQQQVLSSRGAARSVSIARGVSSPLKLIAVSKAKSITGFDYMLTRTKRNPELIMGDNFIILSI